MGLFYQWIVYEHPKRYVMQRQCYMYVIQRNATLRQRKAMQWKMQWHTCYDILLRDYKLKIPVSQFVPLKEGLQ